MNRIIKNLSAPGLVLLVYLIIPLAGNSQTITSPDKKIKVELKFKSGYDKKSPASGQVYFKIIFNNGKEYIEALPESPLGILRKDQEFVTNLKLTGESKPIEIHDQYEMICGKRKSCENFGTEKRFDLVNQNKEPLTIIFRAYNNGVAFRYVFPDHSDSTVTIIDEASTYMIPDGTQRWMQPYENSYEDFFPLNTNGLSTKKEQEWGYPALYKVKDNPCWVLISESDISKSNCAARLSNKKENSAYKVTYPQPGAISSLPWKSQWHVFMIGHLSDIVESTLISDVSEPSKLKETDWIKPGPAAWIYWANNHGSKDYQKAVEYIDLAAKMNWPYVLIDWEWDVMSNGGNIEDATNYARNKGIKPLMWYNSGTTWLDPTPNDRMLTSEKRAKEFAWLNKIGVYGVKVDFFAGDVQEAMKYCIAILEDAAKYHLMVNFHGATIPRGWSRTYPNLMTTEAVYGAEWYNNWTALTDRAATHNTTLPFTRNVIGSMDYTPVTFTNSQHEHITSYSHELALAVLFESGIQHFADRPSGYYSLPEAQQNFLKNFPTTWDDTKFIGGYPGEYAVMARRKAYDWYIGGINGKDTAQVLGGNLSFLEEGRSYTLHLNKDGADPQSFETEVREVRKGDVLKISCLARGGFSGLLKRK
jgi:hypothetical protein